jgi:hypothetical protein
MTSNDIQETTPCVARQMDIAVHVPTSHNASSFRDRRNSRPHPRVGTLARTAIHGPAALRSSKRSSSNTRTSRVTAAGVQQVRASGASHPRFRSSARREHRLLVGRARGWSSDRRPLGSVRPRRGRPPAADRATTILGPLEYDVVVRLKQPNVRARLRGTNSRTWAACSAFST